MTEQQVAGICGERSSAGVCLREPGHVKRHKYTKEELVSGTTLAEIGEQRGHESLGTGEMTDAEAVEVLVRTEPHEVSPGPTGPPKVEGEGMEVKRTQGQMGMFHVLSQIDDGVFVAWDRCRSTNSHPISECTCKGGPTEPPYVTKWREEYLAKRDKKAAKEADKALDVLERRIETPVQVVPTMGEKALDAALDAVEAAQFDDDGNRLTPAESEEETA